VRLNLPQMTVIFLECRGVGDLPVRLVNNL